MFKFNKKNIFNFRVMECQVSSEVHVFFVLLRANSKKNKLDKKIGTIRKNRRKYWQAKREEFGEFMTLRDLSLI